MQDLATDAVHVLKMRSEESAEVRPESGGAQAQQAPKLPAELAQRAGLAEPGENTEARAERGKYRHKEGQRQRQRQVQRQRFQT